MEFYDQFPIFFLRFYSSLFGFGPAFALPQQRKFTYTLTLSAMAKLAN